MCELDELVRFTLRCVRLHPRSARCEASIGHFSPGSR